MLEELRVLYLPLCNVWYGRTSHYFTSRYQQYSHLRIVFCGCVMCSHIPLTMSEPSGCWLPVIINPRLHHTLSNTCASLAENTIHTHLHTGIQFNSIVRTQSRTTHYTSVSILNIVAVSYTSTQLNQEYITHTQLQYQRPWYVSPYLCHRAYKRSRAT